MPEAIGYALLLLLRYAGICRTIHLEKKKTATRNSPSRNSATERLRDGIPNLYILYVG
jgi:hypothetical protein